MPTFTPAWRQTQNTVEQMMDTAPDEVEPVPGMVPVLSSGVSTDDREAKWAPQLFELATMGFVDTARNITLLDRYNGRTLRVINALSEQQHTPAPELVAPPKPTPSPTLSPAPSPPLEEYLDELRQLENMGFSDRATNLQLLRRYNGRVVRVVNYLMEMIQG